MNDWLEGVKRSAFPLAQKLHGMFLHFKTTGYSYPQYKGKTRMSSEAFGKKNKQMIVVVNALRAAIDKPNIDITKYLFVNAAVDIFEARSLYSPTAVKNYTTWADALNSKEVFREKCKALLDNHPAGPAVRRAFDSGSDYRLSDVDDCFMDHLTLYSTADDYSVRLESCFLAVSMAAAFPEVMNREVILEKLMVDKLVKVKAFTDWWCLT